MCSSCGFSGCGGCGRSWPAACSSSCGTRSGGCGNGRRGGCSRNRNNCGCDSCVTSLAILKNTVSERSCCSSDNAHVFAYNVSGTTVPANGNVAFDHVGESHIIRPPGSDGNDATQFKILQGGKFQYDFFVKGIGKTSGVAGTNPLVFELVGNGVQLLGTQYTSQDKEASESSLNHLVHGFGIINVPSGTVVQLHNITGAFGDTVDLFAFPTGGFGSALAINASLRIIKIC